MTDVRSTSENQTNKDLTMSTTRDNLARNGQGFFVAMTGLDGAGKSVQCAALGDALKNIGYDVMSTREPGGTPEAEALRRFVVEGDPDALDAETELLIFMAARRDHLRKAIIPALNRGAVVISDRYVADTIAYQGAAGVSARTILDAHATFCGGVMPDLTVMLTLDPDIAMARSLKKNAGLAIAEDRMEKKPGGFHDKVGRILMEQSANPSWRTINAGGDIKAVSAAVVAAVIDAMTHAA